MIIGNEVNKKKCNKKKYKETKISCQKENEKIKYHTHKETHLHTPTICNKHTDL